jgi:hypothetical protein
VRWLFFTIERAVTQHWSIQELSFGLHAPHASLDPGNHKPLTRMQNEEHQKSTRCEGTIKNEVLKDVLVAGSLVVIDCGNYRLQVQTDNGTEQGERGSNGLSHISIRAKSILVRREQINDREDDNKGHGYDYDDCDNLPHESEKSSEDN